MGPRVLVVTLAVALTGCSAPVGPRPTAPDRANTPSASDPANAPSVPATRQQRYVDAVLADRPQGLWTLADARANAGDAVIDSSPFARDALVVDGPITTTRGPLGAPAARFDGRGRVLTPLVGALRPGRPFTLEFLFRPDSCTRRWTQVAGTAAYDARGREGVNLLHYPQFFPTGCRLALEFWQQDRYTGGCGPPAVARAGSWLHFAASYDGRTVRCYTGGRLSGASSVRGFGFSPTSAFGIGGAGSGYAGTLDSGSLADVAVYGYALTADAVLRHAGLVTGGP